MNISFIIAAFILFIVCLVLCVRYFFYVPEGLKGIAKLIGVVLIITAILLSFTGITYVIFNS
jgi:hypothetical protein